MRGTGNAEAWIIELLHLDREPINQQSINQINQPNQSTNQQPLCTYCNRGTHALENCWVIPLEKRPQRPFIPYCRRDDTNTGAANLVDDTVDSSDGCIFDTGAGWTISNNKSAFINFIPINHEATVDLPDGSTHHVVGIGTIRVLIGDEFIELKNVRYIPGYSRECFVIAIG